MDEPSDRRVTIWLDEDGETLEFFPVAAPLAKWTVRLPEGARLVSCSSRGILIQETNGNFTGANTAFSCAKARVCGYDVVDGYDPDHWLEKLEI
jgi:hypothetical protein